MLSFLPMMALIPVVKTPETSERIFRAGLGLQHGRAPHLLAGPVLGPSMT